MALGKGAKTEIVDIACIWSLVYMRSGVSKRKYVPGPKSSRAVVAWVAIEGTEGGEEEEFGLNMSLTRN